MTVLPVNPAADPTPEGLQAFLVQCREAARAAGRPKLVSISLVVDHLDPLAVLESIFEPGELHFYAEHPSAGFAVAGAEAVVAFTAGGVGRFRAAQEFIRATLADTLAVGPVGQPFGGPHFFVAAGFLSETPADAPFPSLRLFVPRWQVAQTGGGTMAVANLPVTPDAPVELLAAKVWRAHAKFRRFDYRAQPQSGRPRGATKIEEVGPAGHYADAVQRALQMIAAGELQKIVLARAKTLTAADEFHPLGVLNHLRRRFPDCYAFSVGNGRGQSFIGASPERLVRVAGRRMHTAALAGTAPRGETASEDAALARELLHSEKNLREHRLVLGSILRRLADLGLALEYPPQPRLLGLANVQHLHTPVGAALPAGVDLLDLVERLYPTPAVGGTPREPAVRAIPRLESFSRGLYAGALGWVDARGEGELFVGLRSALIDGATATAFAGAGIVAGSEPEKEFAETEFKFQALLDALVQP